MFVVGLETSGLVGSVALMSEGQLLEERTLGQAGRRHAQSLVLELRDVLQQHHVTPREVSTIAVSIGPGSFTGLRVGLVCAKTFAYATGCQFIAVDTFAAIAENCPLEVQQVWVVENAQREEVFVGQYARRESSSWTQITPIEIAPADEWLAARTADEVLIGPGLAFCELGSLRARHIAEEAMSRPKASTIARLGQQRLLARDAMVSTNEFDFWKATPFYFRPSAAEEQRAKALKPTSTTTTPR